MNRTASAGEVWIAAHPLPMRSTYEAVLGTEPAYTSCHSKFIGTVDYIWFTPEVRTCCRLCPASAPAKLDTSHSNAIGISLKAAIACAGHKKLSSSRSAVP